MKRLLLPLILAGLVPVHADVKLPSVFGDHMVLQQGKTLPVWGMATPGEKITVKIGARSGNATAGPDGKWQVSLEPLPEGKTGTTLTVAGTNTVTFQDVVVGDVWLASGQSNMELRMADIENSQNNVVDVKQVIADSVKYPLIRIFHVENKPGIVPKWDVGSGKWEVASPDAVRNSSAVAYFFATTLQDKLHQPIGLIDTYWGGQPIQTFMSAESLQALPFAADSLKSIQPKQDAWNKLTPDQQAQAMTDFQKAREDYEHNIEGPFNQAMYKWRDADAAAKAANQPEPPQPKYPSVPRPESPDGEAGWPTVLFNGMINPVIPYAIKGALWYQGESNGGNSPDSDHYGQLFEAMISDWRARWHEPDFTFISVGLANFGYRFPDPVDEGWAHVREGMTLAEKHLKNVGVGEAVDIGEAHGIHPIDKADVGRRLAAAALHIAYGEKGPWIGPVFESMTASGGKISVKFAHTGAGLKLGLSPHADVPQATDKPVGFAIAGDDKKWVWADAKIVGDSVELSSASVPNPVAVRYGWANNPALNLYNAEGFPAEPFRTDNWPFVSPPNAPQNW